MAERRILSFIIDLKDQASEGIKSLSGTIRSRFGKVVDVFKKVALGAVAFTTALTLLTQRGGKVLGVQRAFGIVVGDSAAALAKLTAASRGLISEYDLMVGFNRAVALGAADNVEQFEELTEVSLSLGRALGVDAAFALESLSLGIGRQSRLFLDNLGLVISVEEAHEKYAEQLGVATSELTLQEQKIAFRNAALDAATSKIEELGGIEGTAADSATRFRVAISDGRDELAKLIATSPLVEQFFETLIGLVEGTVTVMRKFILALEIMFGEVREQTEETEKLTTAYISLSLTYSTLPGHIENTTGALVESLSVWQLIGLEMILMTDRVLDLQLAIAGGLVDALNTFSAAFSRGLTEWAQGTSTLGQALEGAFLSALASIANSFAQFYAAQAVAALGAGILGDPRGFAAAAKYTAAAILMGTVAGVASAGARGGGGGGGALGAGAVGFDDQLAGAGARTGGTIIIQGGILDMSDPRQADSFADALEDITGMRRGSITLVQG